MDAEVDTPQEQVTLHTPLILLPFLSWYLNLGLVRWQSGKLG